MCVECLWPFRAPGLGEGTDLLSFFSVCTGFPSPSVREPSLRTLSLWPASLGYKRSELDKADPIAITGSRMPPILEMQYRVSASTRVYDPSAWETAEINCNQTHSLYLNVHRQRETALTLPTLY